jgi:hypothetical protein
VARVKITDISDVLGVTRNTIYATLTRAREAERR